MTRTNSTQTAQETPTLNDIMRAISDAKQLMWTPSKARMNEMTWAIMCHDPRITNFANPIPAPNYSSVAGLKVVFDDTLPIGKVEYE